MQHHIYTKFNCLNALLKCTSFLNVCLSCVSYAIICALQQIDYNVFGDRLTDSVKFPLL